MAGGVLSLAALPLFCADAMAQDTVGYQIPFNTAVTVATQDSLGDIANQGGNACGADLPYVGGPDNFDPAAYVITVSAFTTVVDPFGTFAFATLVPYAETGWTDVGDIPGSDAANSLFEYDNPPFGAAAVATITWSEATQLISNTTTVQNCQGCAWNLFLFAGATSNFTVDVLGYYDDAGAYTAIDGCRVMDTRKWAATPTTTTTLAPTTTTTVAPTTTTTVAQ